MRIVLLTEAYAPIQNGVVHVVKLSHDELLRRGHKVDIITPQPHGLHTRSKGVHYVPALPLPGGSGYQLACPAISTADQLIKRANVIHTHHPFTLGSWGLKLAKKLKKPFLFTNHTQYVQYLHHVPIIGGLLRIPVGNSITRFANRCTIVIAPALSTEEELLESGVTAPIQHVPNGIETDRFSRGNGTSIRIRLGLDPKTPLLLYTGRIAPEKNIEFLVRAVASMKERPQLALVGDGPAKSDIETLVTKLKARDHIHLLGALSYQQMPDAYAAGTIFVTASVTEVHPLVVLEAFAAGLPAVVMNARGTADIVSDGKTGLICQKTRTDFTRAIRRLLKDSTLRHRLGRAAKKEVNDKYSVRASVNQLLDTYRIAQRLAATDDA